MIRKVGKSYHIYSEKTGKRLGTYSTKGAALKRLRQIEYFKRAKQTRN